MLEAGLKEHNSKFPEKNPKKRSAPEDRPERDPNVRSSSSSPHPTFLTRITGSQAHSLLRPLSQGEAPQDGG